MLFAIALTISIAYYELRYQKKIGTYDKQQWEKTIEQRILHGLTHIHPMKTKPPKTEFIDLDLVRGKFFFIHIFLNMIRLGVNCLI